MRNKQIHNFSQRLQDSKTYYLTEQLNRKLVYLQKF